MNLKYTSISLHLNWNHFQKSKQSREKWEKLETIWKLNNDPFVRSTSVSLWPKKTKFLFSIDLSSVIKI